MSSFKEIQINTESKLDFRSECENVAQLIINAGNAGCSIDKSNNVFKFDSHWDGRCIDLGEKIKDCVGVTPAKWMSWMRNAKIKNDYTEIKISTRSAFFARNIMAQFASHITEKTNKIVSIVIDDEIKRSFNAQREFKENKSKRGY